MTTSEIKAVTTAYPISYDDHLATIDPRWRHEQFHRGLALGATAYALELHESVVNRLARACPYDHEMVWRAGWIVALTQLDAGVSVQPSDVALWVLALWHKVLELANISTPAEADLVVLCVWFDTASVLWQTE